MNVGTWALVALMIAFGLFIAPSLTTIGLLFAGLYIFFKGKAEMDED
jgi:ABC-type Na+ efflux pump permease subunit